MIVTVRLFAILRERVGRAVVPLTLGPGATVASAWEALVADHPDIADLRRALRFAVNGIYADEETALHDGDEVGFLPPVSGGGHE